MTSSLPCQTFLEKILNIQRTETPAVIGGIVMFFLLFTSYAILRPVRDTMGIAGGIQNLQWLFTATFVAAIVMQFLFGWLASKVPRRTIFPWVYAFFVLNLLGFVLALQMSFSEAWVARTFYVWLSVFNLLAVSVAWSLLADIMPGDQSKRLFALVASGSSAGAMTGSVLTTGLVTFIGHTGLMLISMALLAAAGVAGVALHRWRDRNPVAETAAQRENRRKPIGGNPFSGVTAVFRSLYLIGIAVFVLLLASTTTFLYFELMRAVAVTFPDPARQTQVFSLIDVVVNTLTLGFQIFLTGRIAQKFGVGVLLVTVPVIIAFGFVWMAFTPVFMLVAFFMVIRRVGQYALVRPGREMLYTVMTPEEKYKAKNFIDTVLYRGGDMLSAWLRRALDIIGENPGPAMIAGALIAALWAATGLGLAKIYRKKEKDDPLNESFNPYSPLPQENKT